MSTYPNNAHRPEDLPPRWKARYDRIAEVTALLGRLPRRSDPNVNPRDVAWIADQRRALNLTPAQSYALAQLPGWFEGTRDGAWYARAEELRAFIDLRGRRPRVRAGDQEERALAHWYSRQHVALRRGELRVERASALIYVFRALGREIELEQANDPLACCRRRRSEAGHVGDAG